MDVFGNRIREINRVAPLRSKDITLTLDINLQRLARQELNSRRGAIVALDPSNGHIKAMVSSPDYNPNILNRSEFDIPLAESSLDEAPFFNRAISGSYPPASTIKPFIGLLGLEEKIIDASTIIEDVGFFQLKEESHKNLQKQFSTKSLLNEKLFSTKYFFNEKSVSTKSLFLRKNVSKSFFPGKKYH